ncbi:hypothetical protein J3Q64DRAFT_1646064, partial [Phycomyces blakesleeanus]
TAIRSILAAYPERYGFEKNSIYYDSKASPHNHSLDFFYVPRLLIFHLRRSWSPCYMQIDTGILC